VPGVGFGNLTKNIKVICHDQADPGATVIVDDVRQATLTEAQVTYKVFV